MGQSAGTGRDVSPAGLQKDDPVRRMDSGERSGVDMGRYLLAHDIGTSGDKAVLYQENGRLVASAVAAYDTSYPHPGWVEQDPEAWWRAVCESTKKLLRKAKAEPGQVACVSFSGQMMGCLPVDRAGKPLRPMITWADTRSASQEQEIICRLGLEKVYRITGHRPSASYSAAKLLWVRDNEPEIYKKTYRMLQAKDFIVHRLTRRFITDYSDAGGTNLFDIRRKEWSEEICGSLGIPMGLLPEAYPSATVAGSVTGEAACACGLKEGTPVVIGGGDGSCACVGAGAVEEGEAYCVLGSSSWISTVNRQPVFDGQLRTFNWVHLDPALYTPCGTMQAAGLSYGWYRDTFCKEEKRIAGETGESLYDLLDREMEKSGPGAGGVLYLPYLLGERSPRWNHAARGAFIGMDARTKKADMARAVLEGVGYNLKVILDILEGPGEQEALTLIGGGARGRLWAGILADIWGKPLRIPADPEEATGLGAAVCGGVGIGMFADYRVVKEFRKAAESIEPDPVRGKCYQRYYEIFNRAYEALVPVYEELAALPGHLAEA